MKYLLSIITSLITLLSVWGFTSPKQLTSADVIKKMYSRYHGKWHTSLTFTQTTGRYRNDTLVKTDTWHERIVYPDMLRIDFGADKSGNGVIYRGDSSYIFRNNKVVRAAKDENELIFFLGGLYFKPIDQVLTHFNELHFDLGKSHESTWKGKAVYILGSAKDDDKVTQLWIDKEKLVAVRYFKYDVNGKMEATFEEHKMIEGAWSETLCKFYMNDKLLQTEVYNDIKANQPIDKSVFDPALIGK
jgi:outer membrane lipoprotein-sorting protein